MRIFHRNTKPMTHYQRVKRKAARTMTVMGIIFLALSLATLFISGLAVTLFFAGSSIGFLLVGFQQEIDAAAAGNEDLERREPDG